MRTKVLAVVAALALVGAAVGIGSAYAAGPKVKKGWVTIRLNVRPKAQDAPSVVGQYQVPPKFRLVVEHVSRSLSAPESTATSLNSLGVSATGGPGFPGLRRYSLNQHPDNGLATFQNGFGNFDSDPACVVVPTNYQLSNDSNEVHAVIESGEWLGIQSYMQGPETPCHTVIEYIVTGELVPV